MIITAESSDGSHFIETVINKEPNEKPNVSFWKSENKTEFMVPKGEVSSSDIQFSEDDTIDEAYNVVEKYLTGKGYKIVSVNGQEPRG